MSIDSQRPPIADRDSSFAISRTQCLSYGMFISLATNRDLEYVQQDVMTRFGTSISRRFKTERP